MISKGERPAIISNMRTPSAHQSTLNPGEKRAVTRREVAGKLTHSARDCECAKGCGIHLCGRLDRRASFSLEAAELARGCDSSSSLWVTLAVTQPASSAGIAAQTCRMGPRTNPALLRPLLLFYYYYLLLLCRSCWPSNCDCCPRLWSACHHNRLSSCFHLRLQSPLFTEERSSVGESSSFNPQCCPNRTGRNSLL